MEFSDKVFVNMSVNSGDFYIADETEEVAINFTLNLGEKRYGIVFDSLRIDDVEVNPELMNAESDEVVMEKVVSVDFSGADIEWIPSSAFAVKEIYLSFDSELNLTQKTVEMYYIQPEDDVLESELKKALKENIDSEDINTISETLNGDPIGETFRIEG